MIGKVFESSKGIMLEKSLQNNCFDSNNDI